MVAELRALGTIIKIRNMIEPLAGLVGRPFRQLFAKGRTSGVGPLAISSRAVLKCVDVTAAALIAIARGLAARTRQA
jgi:hypothetical protein